MPLTADRAKPAVPFGGIYRLIDFALSNLVNSGYLKIVVLTQYKSHSLDRHITRDLADVDAARQLRDPGAGPAAHRQELVPGQRRRHLPEPEPHPRPAPDIVVVVGADHVYRMDFSQMVDAAHRQRGRRDGRRRSVSRSRWPTSSASSRSTPTDPPKIARVPREAPGRRPGLADSPDEVLASMGNYVFDADALVDAVTRDAERVGQQARHGRRHHPRLRRPRARPTSTTSKDNPMPGSTDRDHGYWRDVGTIDSYYDAQMDLDLVPSGVQPLQLRVADLHRATATPRRPSSSTGRRAGSAARSTLRSPPVS